MAVFFGAVLWGLHMGASEGLLSALVADSCPEDLRGTAFGIFNLASGYGLALSKHCGGLALGCARPKLDVHGRRDLCRTIPDGDRDLGAKERRV